MNSIDSYFRALIDYRKITEENRDCLLARKSVAHAISDVDQIETVRYTCQVDEDWITAIESGIPWIEKAIKEDRQFITSQGEVLPIEKVKRISRESIVHLAQSSEMLYKNEDPEDTSINPKELYTIERYSDFSVYENRFLYMLLVYTQDFISMRYDKIMDFSTRYQGNLYLKKKVERSGSLIDYEIKMKEVRKNDSYLMEKSSVKSIVDRIFDLSMSVSALLKTPLMQEVAKAPMLKPPITKTNVLKMAINFKKAFALYDFLMAYNKDGFKITEEKKVLSDFNDDSKTDLSELVLLMSFLSYEYGLDIRRELKASYDQENKRLADAKKEELQQKIIDLKERLRKKELTPEEFILALEQRNKQLEQDTKELAPLKKHVEQLNDEIAKLTRDNEILTSNVKELKNNISEMELSKKEDIEKIKNDYRQKAIEMQDKFEDDKEDYKSEVFVELDKAKKAFRTEKANFQKQVEISNKKNKEIMDKYNAMQRTFAQLEQDRKLLEQERDMAVGQNIAYRKELGISAKFDEGDLTKEEFEELERIFGVMEKYFNGKWKDVKKLIRKDILGSIRITLRKDPSVYNNKPENDDDDDLRSLLVDDDKKTDVATENNNNDHNYNVDNTEISFDIATQKKPSSPAPNNIDATEVVFETPIKRAQPIEKPLSKVESAYDAPSIGDFDMLGKTDIQKTFGASSQRDELGAREKTSTRENFGKQNTVKSLSDDDLDDIFGDDAKISNSSREDADIFNINNTDDDNDGGFDGFDTISKG